MSDFSEQIREKGYALFISENGMEAMLYITNLMRYELSIPGINQLLKDEKITTGIDHSAVADMVSKQKYNCEINIAKGKEPQDGQDGSYTFHFNCYQNTVPKVLEDGSVDYRDIELFTFVEHGQLLAEYVHATPGAMGFSVTGKLLMPVKGKEKPAIRGTGFLLNDDATSYYARTAGKITYKTESTDVSRHESIIYQFMEISPVFVHQGSLLYREGDIDFDGDVLIRGDVQTGVTIKATGDVEIEGIVEAVNIKSGGNILVKKGIIGTGKGYIEARGSLRGKFFESVYLNASLDIECNYLFNCVAKTDSMIKVKGNKGSIVAGKVYAMMGIEAFTLGNESGVSTYLSVGVTKTSTETSKQLDKKIEDVSLEVDVFRKNCFPEKPFYSKIVLALELKEAELEDLLKKQQLFQNQITKAAKAAILIKGMAYAGAIIEMEEKKLELKQTLKSVHFRKQGEHIAVFCNS